MERDVAWKKYDEADLEALEHLAAEYIDFISDNKDVYKRQREGQVFKRK